MQPLPAVSKAYGMLRQEEKQRDSPKPQPPAPIALNTYRNNHHSSNRTSSSSTPSNNPVPNTQNDRRANFRKGILCAYCKKEGHFKEECYKL